MRVRDVVLFVTCVVFARPDAPRSQSAARFNPTATVNVGRPEPMSTAARRASRGFGPATDRALLVDDPPSLERLERSGLAFNRMITAEMRSELAASVATDIDELAPGLTRTSVQRPFRAEWFRRGRLELIGVVNRFDRAVFDPPEARSCGEARLVYRLALDHPSRPATRLPLTVNVRIPLVASASDSDRCRGLASRALAEGAAAILPDPPTPAKVEINFQSIHVPAFRTDMDDHAEYVQRTFRVAGAHLVPDVLFATPRESLTSVERRALARWVADQLAAIDRGSAVVPDAFLATRTVSVSPRGLVHAQNRPFSRLFGEGEGRQELDAALGAKGRALASLKRATTRELLLRRLDEMTCPGCHQSRGIAGFHLLGEERDPDATFNALAVGHSPHLAAELPWRRAVLESSAHGTSDPFAAPRPFAGRSDGPGQYGAECGVAPGLAAWTCAPGLVCRDLHHAEIGVCAPDPSTRAGEPCEAVRTAPSTRPEGALVTSSGADVSCPAPVGAQEHGLFCAPNWLGFTGGMCSERCPTVGEVQTDARGGTVCAPLPAAGYEADCFLSREPVEECLQRHFVTARIATCDASTLCRDDYACARIPDAPPGVGACIPPYFVFQLRVDGPVLDR